MSTPTLQEVETLEDTRTTIPTPVRPRARPETERPKLLPPYGVILHNDPVNGFDYVVRTLCKVFGYGPPKAFWLTQRAHTSGRSCVWTGHRELAELKADQLRSCGPDPAMRCKGAGTLGVSIESLPTG